MQKLLPIILAVTAIISHNYALGDEKKVISDTDEIKNTQVETTSANGEDVKKTVGLIKETIGPTCERPGSGPYPRGSCIIPETEK